MKVDSKQKGKLAALSIVKKLKPEEKARAELDINPIVSAINLLSKKDIDLSAIVDAISNNKQQPIDLTSITRAINNKKHEQLDLTPLIKAVSKIKLNNSIDFSQITASIAALAKKPSTDLTQVVNKLDEIKQGMDANTKVLAELVEVAGRSKIVSYDKHGRIKEIKAVK